MKRSIYGKKMFIADLIIVSLWALFAWHEVGCGFIMSALMVMRVSLSFELFRNSRWASLTAWIFAVAYIACIFLMSDSKYVVDPISDFIYVLLCLCGQSELAIVSFNTLDTVIPKWIIWSVWGVISGWLVLMPILFSLRLKGCTRILFRKHYLWWYLTFVTVTLLFWLEVKEMTIFVFAVLMTLTPLAYWMLYSGRKLQLLQYILRDRILMGYVGIIAIFYIAVIIGLYNIWDAKFLAAFVLPVVLYVIANRLTWSSISTITAMMIGLGGIFFINCYNRPHEFVIAWLCVGMAFTLVGTILTFRCSRNLLTSILLFIASGILLPVLLLGYNPYAVINADYVDLMKTYYPKAPNGLYEFSVDGYLGMRDRYGIVVPPQYDNMDFLEGTSDYIVLATGESNSPDYDLQVFDLYAREYIIPDYEYRVAKIKMIDYHKYALLDKNDEQIYTLCLTVGEHYSSKYETCYMQRNNSPYLVICKHKEYNDPRTEFSSNLEEAEQAKAEKEAALFAKEEAENKRVSIENENKAKAQRSAILDNEIAEKEKQRGEIRRGKVDSILDSVGSLVGVGKSIAIEKENVRLTAENERMKKAFPDAVRKEVAKRTKALTEAKRAVELERDSAMTIADTYESERDTALRQLREQKTGEQHRISMAVSRATAEKDKTIERLQGALKSSRYILNIIADIFYKASEVFRRAIEAIIHFATEQHKSIFSPSEAADIKSVMQSYGETTEQQKAVGTWLCDYAEHRQPFDEIKHRHTLNEVGDVAEGRYDWKIEKGRGGISL